MIFLGSCHKGESYKKATAVLKPLHLLLKSKLIWDGFTTQFDGDFTRCEETSYVRYLCFTGENIYSEDYQPNQPSLNFGTVSPTVVNIFFEKCPLPHHLV